MIGSREVLYRKQGRRYVPVAALENAMGVGK